eukprot:4010477-Pleurochrysis_carterae.AAC.1
MGQEHRARCGRRRVRRECGHIGQLRSDGVVRNRRRSSSACGRERRNRRRDAWKVRAGQRRMRNERRRGAHGSAYTPYDVQGCNDPQRIVAACDEPGSG